MQQTLELTNRTNLPIPMHPVRHGLPWPRGKVQPNASISATDEAGQPVPIASRTLQRWPDGSVQWSLIDLAVDMPASAKKCITIKANADEAASVDQPVVIKQTNEGITASNGLTRVTLLASPGDSLVADWDAGKLDAILIDETGEAFSAAASVEKNVQVEDANSMRAILRVDGKHTSATGQTLLHYWLRITLTAGRPDATITYHYHNLEDSEPGINLKQMTIKLDTPLSADCSRSVLQLNRGRGFKTQPVRVEGDLEICASNTMDLDTYPQRHEGLSGGGAGRVFIRNIEQLDDDPAEKPWFLRDVVDFKFKSTDKPEAYTSSHVGLVDDEKSIVVAGHNMIGLHPKSLRVEGASVSYDIWPMWAGMMDITQGEGRTLDLHVSPRAEQLSDEQVIAQYLSWELGGLYAHWGAQPAVQVSPDITHIRSCEVFEVHRLPEFQPTDRFAFERKVQAKWAPDEAAPANGHWHYGDVFYGWEIGGNNEEMAGHVWFQEYLRTGRPVCLDRGLAQAQHIADVDICAHSSDPYQRGGMCAHGPRHNHCAAYPSHMWFTELLFAYALTGDEEYKRAAKRVCDNLVFWVNDPTGFDVVCNDGREAGQPLINLSWAYPWLPDATYLDAINKIVHGAFMQRVETHGSLTYMKPSEDLPLIAFPSYGEWAAWEGLFCAWRVTQYDTLRNFILDQLDTRLTEDQMATSGTFRTTDFNSAAYAYYLSGSDPTWLHRVARPFQAMFRASDWPMGYIKSMYFLKLAFDHELIHDEQVLIS